MGKDIKLKADKALLEGKKYLSYWTEFMGKVGKFPSGKNEDDALAHVLSRIQVLADLEDLHHQEEDDDNEEEEDNSSQEFSIPHILLYRSYSRKWGTYHPSP